MELAEKGVKVRSMYENHIVFGPRDACLKREKKRPVYDSKKQSRKKEERRMSTCM